MGRPKGSPNKITKDIKLLAQPYTAEAVDTLVSIMRAADNEATRIAATKELMNRAWGQAHTSGELKVETRRYVVEVPATVPTEEWEKRFQPVQH